MTVESATLVYMPGRGIADSIRLMLEVGGWNWDEHHPESREAFLVLKKETVHGTIPYIRIYTAETVRTLEQIPAILKYLARRAGLYPEQIDEQYKVDMLCSLLCDFTNSIGFAPFASDPDEGIANLQTDLGPRYFPSLERALCDNRYGDGFCGKSLSFVDLQAFAAIVFLPRFSRGRIQFISSSRSFRGSNCCTSRRSSVPSAAIRASGRRLCSQCQEHSSRVIAAVVWCLLLAGKRPF